MALLHVSYYDCPVTWRSIGRPQARNPDRQIYHALAHARLVADLDDGRDMVIHAMPMRPQYETLLPPQEPLT